LSCGFARSDVIAEVGRCGCCTDLVLDILDICAEFSFVYGNNQQSTYAFVQKIAHILPTSGPGRAEATVCTIPTGWTMGSNQSLRPNVNSPDQLSPSGVSYGADSQLAPQACQLVLPKLNLSNTMTMSSKKPKV